MALRGRRVTESRGIVFWSVLVALVPGWHDALGEPGERDMVNGRVQGRVVQVTASEVFIDVGASHGIEAGDIVTIGVTPQSVQVQVLDVSASHARCRLNARDRIPGVGATVSAAKKFVAKPQERYRTRHLAKPRRVDELLANWRGLSFDRPVKIAYGQESVQDSERLADRRIRGALAVEYAGLIDPRADRRDRQYHQFALRSDLDVPSFFGGRLNYQHRLRMRTDVAPDLDSRPFALSRSILRIYRMQVGFRLDGWHGAVGRTLVGMPGASLPGGGLIDGVNVRTRVADKLHVGAWVGTAPRINDLFPTGDTLSFGVFGSMRRELQNRMRTRVAIDGGFLGTTFDGVLDRQALSVRASVSETDRWMHGQIILDVNAPTRPTIEPSFAFIDAGIRMANSVRAVVRFEHVRSLRTAEARNALPPGYLSTEAFTSVQTSVSMRVTPGLYLAARAGWRAIAEGVGNLTASVDARAQGLWLADDRISLGIAGALGSHVDGYAMRANYTLPLHRRVDISAGYRFSGYRYRGYIYGDTTLRLYRHQPSLSLDGRVSRRLHGHLDIDALFDAEAVVLATFVHVSMRF